MLARLVVVAAPLLLLDGLRVAGRLCGAFGSAAPPLPLPPSSARISVSWEFSKRAGCAPHLPPTPNSTISSIITPTSHVPVHTHYLNIMLYYL